MEFYVDNRSRTEVDGDLLAKLEQCALECLRVEGFPENVEISLSLVDNEEIHQLNKEYRNVDSPTDVLSFPMLEGDEDLGQEVILLGDIIISLKKTQEQAVEYGHSFNRELCYLTIHGMFHLLGYDHMKEKDKLEMRAAEKKVVKTMNIV